MKGLCSKGFLLLRGFLANPVFMFSFILFISVFSLAAAYIAQYIFDLKPCILCIYQRIPFAFTAVFSLIGLIFYAGRSVFASVVMLILSASAFFINSIIALHHTGVEQGWWVSVFEACESDLPTKSNDILSSLEKLAFVPCTQISWVDPIFGFSMANYNMVMCLGLFLICTVGAFAVANCYDKSK